MFKSKSVVIYTTFLEMNSIRPENKEYWLDFVAKNKGYDILIPYIARMPNDLNLIQDQAKRELEKLKTPWGPTWVKEPADWGCFRETILTLDFDI